MALPPPPSFAAAPGQQPYDSSSNGQGNPAHMPPPPLPPVVLPQHTNPIPTAVASPGGVPDGILSPSSAGSFVRRAAPEPNKRALYVGGLEPRVTEDVLRQIFETTGHVQSVKIIPDKNVGAVSGTSLQYINLRSLLVCVCFQRLCEKERCWGPSIVNGRHVAGHLISAVCPSCGDLSEARRLPFIHPKLWTTELMLASRQTKGFNYGFVEYDDPGAAERAMHTLNGRRIHNAVSVYISEQENLRS